MIRSSLALACLALTASAAPTRGTADVVVRIAADAAYATVTLDRPVTEFRFEPADVVRDGAIEILTPDLALKNDAVTAATPFRRIAFRIAPNTRERDAKYPAYYPVGAGGLLYAPVVRADPAGWRTRLRLTVPGDHIRLPATGTDGYVLIGPKALVRDTPALAVAADPGTPAWLVAQSERDMTDAIRLFGAAMRLPLPHKPLLVVNAHTDPTSNSFVGDVTPGPVTALRFRGPNWSQTDPAAAQRIRGFIRHEVFHFWNGGMASNAADAPSWLHEGGADYAALLAGQMSGQSSDAAIAQQLADALTRCRSALEREGDKGLAELGFLSQQVRYPCGMVIQWAADLSTRRASGGRRTVLDAWGDTIRTAARRPDRSYTLADFYRAVGVADIAALPPAELIVARSGPDRWEQMQASFAGYGVTIDRTTTAQQRLGTALMHILGQSCRGLPANSSFGFYLRPDGIQLQSPRQCGVLAGDPWIATIEGETPAALGDAAYATIQRKCAAGQTVKMTTRDGRAIDAPCAAPLGPAPKSYVVRNWRPG